MLHFALYYSIILSILFLIATGTVTDEDVSWIQAEELMKAMTKRIDPISNSSLYFRSDTDITFAVPVDYIPEYEEYKFNNFWDNEKNIRQKQLYNLLRDSPYNFMNSNSTYILMRNFFSKNIISPIIKSWRSITLIKIQPTE